MSMDAKQFKERIVWPICQQIDTMNDRAGKPATAPIASFLLLGTAAVESALGKYLHQIEGPAIGVYQMESSTLADIHNNFVSSRPSLNKLVDAYTISDPDAMTLADELHGNMYFATLMARIHYLRVPEAVPTTVEGLARYWKKYYNTPLGKGTEQKFIDAWDKYIAPTYGRF